MTKIAKKIAFYLVLGALLVSPLILAELILRQIGLGEPVLYETNAAYRYAPRPDQRMQRRRDAWITINESGLRSTEAWRGAAGTKILFVGDSVTWSGTNIDDSGTFPERVCALIESETGEDAVCGNAGVNGYGVDNMVKRLRYGGFADADAIVAVVLPGDLKRAEASFQGGPWMTRPPPGPFPALWELATHIGYNIMNGLRGAVHRDDRFDIPVGRESMNDLIGVLRRATAAGKTVLLVLSPYEMELAGEAYRLTPVADTAMKHSGLPYLDMRPAMRKAAEETAEVDGPLYVDGVHLDYRGHEIYGREIGRRLIGLGLGR